MKNGIIIAVLSILFGIVSIAFIFNFNFYISFVFSFGAVFLALLSKKMNRSKLNKLAMVGLICGITMIGANIPILLFKIIVYFS